MNLEPLVVDDWQYWVMLDEVGQEHIWVWANLIHLCPDTEKKVVFGTFDRAAVTHLDKDNNEKTSC